MRRPAASALAIVGALLAGGGLASAQPDDAGGDPDDGSGEPDEPDDAEPPAPSGPLATYFAELEKMGLVDVESGDKDTLTAELANAERLLHDGAWVEAATQLYGIVESPRYTGFKDFVEYQNAEYDLAVALTEAGSQGAALDIVDRILARGPSAPYFGPAHRRAVDIALDSRDHAGVLTRLESIKLTDPLPPSAAGERSYLRGRALYEAGQLKAAEDELATISKKSRLYSSSVYLRGVIHARQQKWQESAEAMCEVAQTPDNDKFTFVVDERYFTIKDLARMGLGRLAHEKAEYDDAYYHYFQIPDDSERLNEALFEAAWSMYQKRELPTSRDLVRELLTEFPTSPLWPEAGLLAGYTDLADCKFDDSLLWYDQLLAKLQPVVDEMDAIRRDKNRRNDLFARALTRYREIRTTGKIDGKVVGTASAPTRFDDVLALLRIDAEFVRLSDAVTGLDRAVAEAPAIVRRWKGLARQVGATRVGATTGEKTIEEETAEDAGALAEDYVRLGEEVDRAVAELERGRTAGTIEPGAAEEEQKRLFELGKRVAAAGKRAKTESDAAAEELAAKAAPGLKPLIQKDVAEAQRLEADARALRERMTKAVDDLTQQAMDRLWVSTRRVLDKAKLGKIDAVIGQKRALDIQVQDLAAGRFPPELIARLWNAGLIGDDEEFWPFEGEYWADEYEGWR
jgi:hypothetical protein